MSILEPAAVAASITPDELRARLDDPTLTIVDVRPIAAYNGWRLAGEARGGHVPGAKAFPATWLGSVDQPEIARLLAEKGAIQGRDIVVYGDGDTRRACPRGLPAGPGPPRRRDARRRLHRLGCG